MENPNSEEHNSGSVCEGICKSAIPKYVDSEMMERIYACICDKKTALRNSAKLKNQIHTQVNELIEILRERERQLSLEIDEINIDQCEAVRIIAELCNYASTENSRANTPVIKQSSSDDQDNQRVHSTTFFNSDLEFVSNFNEVKAILQNFGHLKKSELSSESSETESIENILDNQLTDDQVSNASSSAEFIEKLTEHFERSNVERFRKDSSGSADSFEVIDHSDEAFKQFSEVHKHEDDMDQISNLPTSNTVAAENQVIPASDSPATTHEPQQRYKLKTHWMIDSKQLREVLNHKKKKKSKSASKPLWPPADCRILPPPDPTKRLRKQLKEMSVSKKPSQSMPNLETCADHRSEKSKDVKDKEAKVQHIVNPLIPSNLGNWSSPIKIESNSCLTECKPIPSAMIQETFGKFLDPNSQGKWLASPNNCFQPAIKSDSHLLIAKRLHFQVQ